MALFAFKDVSFTYPSAAKPALRQVSLSVEPGEFAVLCGASGCGKTTLLRHCKSALAPAGRRQGSVLFDGVPLDQVDARTQSARIGFVLQDPDAQLVTDKVWHELAFGLENLGEDPELVRVRTAEMASYFGISAWFRSDAGELSGGQKQLLNLASVMALQPDVLVLDEPTGQLDPLAASEFLQTLRKMNQDLGVTVLLSEHRLEEAFALADRVVALDAGCVMADASPREAARILHERGGSLAASLPTPARVYYAAKDEGTVDKAPLTVREGRAWLAKGMLLSAETAAACELPLPPDACGAHAEVAGVSGEAGVLLDISEGPCAHAEGAGAIRSLALEASSDSSACCGHAEDAGTEMPSSEARSLRDASSERPSWALELRDFWFRYGRDLPDVLGGADLAVREGAIHAIVGANGCGKSTLLKLLTGRLRPYRGHLRVFGRSFDPRIVGAPDGIALLPQDPCSLFVKQTVREELDEMQMPDAPADDPFSRESLINWLGIAELLDRNPFDLSGGEQQRVGLAKVLLTHPRIVALDEPTKGMDEAFKRELADRLRALCRQGLTVLFVSHDIEFCARCATEVSLLFDGQLLATGTPRRFFGGNAFYTTAANRMARHLCQDAIVDEDVLALLAARTKGEESCR